MGKILEILNRPSGRRGWAKYQYHICFGMIFVAIICQAIFSWKIMNAVYERVDPREQMKGLKSIKKGLGKHEDLLAQFIEARASLSAQKAKEHDIENPREPSGRSRCDMEKIRAY